MTIFVAVEHGACEITVCTWISEKLKLEIIPVSKDDGKNTISMKETGNFLCNDVFKDLESLNRYYKSHKRYKTKKKLKMEDISIFVIMDVDGDEKSLNLFKSKQMFRSSKFYDCIHPIINNPNMDDVFRKAGFKISDSQKINSYRDALYEIGTVDNFIRLFDGLNTDIPKMIKEMMEHCPNFQH